MDDDDFRFSDIHNCSRTGVDDRCGVFFDGANVGLVVDELGSLVRLIFVLLITPCLQVLDGELWTLLWVLRSRLLDVFGGTALILLLLVLYSSCNRRNRGRHCFFDVTEE